MESSRVMQLYKRSVEKRKIRYIPFIGDGDSSSYSKIFVEMPYSHQYSYQMLTVLHM